jgi:hypothetical protein
MRNRVLSDAVGQQEGVWDIYHRVKMFPRYYIKRFRISLLHAANQRITRGNDWRAMVDGRLEMGFRYGYIVGYTFSQTLCFQCRSLG